MPEGGLTLPPLLAPLADACCIEAMLRNHRGNLIYCSHSFVRSAERNLRKLYMSEHVKLLHGDCLELMQMIPNKSVNMVLADLPYGTTQCKWDSCIDLDLLWRQYDRIIKDNGCVALFAQAPFDKVLGCSNIKNFRYQWVIEKTCATGHLNSKRMPMKAHELLLIFYKKLPTYNPQFTEGHEPVHSFTHHINSELYGRQKEGISGGGSTKRYPRDVLTFKWDTQKSALHPTQKPVALLEYMIRTYTNENDLVVDNCMGSGSTGVACVNANRRFIGIEKDEKYFRIAEGRINSTIENNATKCGGDKCVLS